MFSSSGETGGESTSWLLGEYEGSSGPPDRNESESYLGVGQIVNFDETGFADSHSLYFPSKNRIFLFCMLDFRPKTGFYPVFRFHKKYRSQP